MRFMMSDTVRAFGNLLDIVIKLRSDNGCPWDRKQSVSSLSKYLREEFDELLLAIANNDPENLCEEAGDVLFLIVMLAQINSEEKLFDLFDILSAINKKMIRRHPHVFAGVQITDEDELRRQWQVIKAEEKLKKN
jgi:tetrapyrrole methylase family protein/MazG family protein